MASLRERLEALATRVATELVAIRGEVSSALGAKLDASAATLYPVRIRHGEDAGYARPDVPNPVDWVGSVQPTNLDEDKNDFWYEVEAEVPPFVGAFDGVAAPALALSVRRVLSAYTGPLIRVRRSSDNTEQDISADSSGNLDETALLAFVGANSAYIVTWYDQSGNGRHYTQATAANQPRIVNAGTIDKTNSRPGIVLDGTNDYWSRSPWAYAAGQPVCMAFVLKSNSNAVSNANVLSESNTADNNQFWRPARGSSANLNTQANANPPGSLWASTATGSNVFDLSQHQVFYQEISSAINTWKDNTAAHVALAAARSGTLTPNVASIGAHVGPSVGNYYNGVLQEIVMWLSDRASDRAIIQTIQKTYFGTP